MKTNRFSWVQGLLALALIVSLVLGNTSIARAAEIIPGEFIASETTIDDDALIGGTTVIVDGTVNGNLVAGGETITLNGTVNGDAILMGKTVIVSQSARINGNLFVGAQIAEISGKISGSLFSGAAAVELRNGAEVTGNVYSGSYSFESLPQTRIGRDLFVGGYQARLAGDLDRNLRGAGAAFELYGFIGGDAVINIGNALEQENARRPMNWSFAGQEMPDPIQPGLRFGPQAEIQGELQYTSSQPVSIGIQPAGGVVYSTPAPSQQSVEIQRQERNTSPGLTWLWNLLRSLVTALILGALALWLTPRLMKRSADLAGSKTLPALGIGFLAMVLSVPVVLMALGVIIVLALLFGLLTLGGLAGLIVWVGLTIILAASVIFTFLAFFASKLVVSYLVGKLLFEKVFKAPAISIWLQFFIGILVMTLLMAIPFIGWLIALVVMWIGLGVNWYLLRRERLVEPVRVDPPATF